MKATFNIDDDLLKKASQLTGVSEINTLVNLGLERLVARESARRLAELGGSEKSLRPVRRRKSP
jgi:Arc/MetJ family transcription regulator